MMQTTQDVRWEIAGKLPAISGDGRPQVSEDETQMAQELMEEVGVVLFRGFGMSVEDFRSLTRRLGNSYSLEKWTPDSLSPAGGYIGLHTEQAFLPAIPSSLWFYSVKPAPRGGATIVCDGEAVFSHLSSDAQRFLEQNDVLYWRRHSGKPPDKPYLQIVGDPPGLGRSFREGETIVNDDSYETTALCRPLVYSRFGRRPVFGNHILNTIQHKGQDEPPEIDGFHQARLSNKEQLPHELIAELKSVTSRLCMKFKLGQNDFVWIDNTRYLHGRDPFAGARQIIALKAFHADQWLPGHDPANYRSLTAGAPAATR